MQLQNGISDEVEKRNRIRRLISSFFRDRDCYTLVRPLTDEANLQKLDTTDFSSLRPEFVHEALELRKKIMSMDRRKVMGGKEITGGALADLIVHYVRAINDGAVPNIEGAWIDVCEAQNRRVAETLLNDFSKFLNETQDTLPQPEETLKSELKRKKREILGSFAVKAIGEPQAAAKLAAFLSQKVREMIVEMLNENDH